MTNPTHTNAPAASDADGKSRAVDPPMVQLSELMRGLEIGPDAATWPASALYSLGQKIAAQAKLAAIPQRAPEAIASSSVVSAGVDPVGEILGNDKYGTRINFFAGWPEVGTKLYAAHPSPAANVPAPEGVPNGDAFNKWFADSWRHWPAHFRVQGIRDILLQAWIGAERSRPQAEPAKPEGAAVAREQDDPKYDRSTGLYEKFRVERTNGSSGPGGKHEHCEYFVLDLTHDEHAYAALTAYATSCADDFPQLSNDLREITTAMAKREKSK
jgi:hypothetical protein